jgi:hypothetical protein
MPHEKYQSCIDACNDCSAQCEQCASACLDEDMVQELTRCIKLDLDCALICTMTAKLMSRDSEEATHICQHCAEVCRRCAEECRKHDMSHCRQCAEACERCADECEKMVGELVH